MSGEVYAYFVSFEPNIEKALQNLRLEEFNSGRYDPCMRRHTGKYMFEYPPIKNKIAKHTPCHKSIEEVWSDPEVGADDTRSILDIFRVRTEPFPIVNDPLSSSDIGERFNTAAPVRDESLYTLFKTTKPSTTAVEKTLFFNENLDNKTRDQLFTHFWQ